MRSTSPVPRFEPEVIEIDSWLRRSGAAESTIALYRMSPAGPWLSLADDWYGQQRVPASAARVGDRRLAFAGTPEELVEVARSNPSGHLIVNSVDAIAAQAVIHGEWPKGLRAAVAFANGQYSVIRWGSGHGGELRHSTIPPVN